VQKNFEYLMKKDALVVALYINQHLVKNIYEKNVTLSSKKK